MGPVNEEQARQLAIVKSSGQQLLDLVSEILDISSAQAYALVRSGDLPAIKVGGRGQWRVETVELEAYIARMYAETRDFVSTRSERGGDSEAEPSSER